MGQNAIKLDGKNNKLVTGYTKKTHAIMTSLVQISHPIRDSFPGLFDQSLVHSQHPVLLSGLQSSLHLIPPHLQLDAQTLEQLKRMKEEGRRRRSDICS